MSRELNYGAEHMIPSTKPYIGRQISHFEKVDIAKITPEFSDDKKYRYKLTMPFYPEPWRDKRATIILKNPSSADGYKADKTVYNATKMIYRSFPDVAVVEVLNLFALRGTFPTDVMVAHNSGEDIVGERNDQAIDETLALSHYVVLAWGGAAPIRKSIYDNRINEAHELLKKHLVHVEVKRKAEKGSDRYPFHACYWPESVAFQEIILPSSAMVVSLLKRTGKL